MESSLIEFACTATRVLGQAARTIAEKEIHQLESPKLIDFATRLFNIAEELDKPQPRQTAVPYKRIVLYLIDLERLCTFPQDRIRITPTKQDVGPQDFPRLHEISMVKLRPGLLASPLKSFVRSEAARKTFFRKLDRFLPKQRQPTDKIPEPQPAEELSDSVYAALYDALEPHIECNCQPKKRLSRCVRRHEGYLELNRGSFLQHDDAIIDAVFRASAIHHEESKGRWTFLRFRVTKKMKGSKSLQWAGDKSLDRGDRAQSSNKAFSLMHCDEFCHLLLNQLGPVRQQLRVVENGLHNMGMKEIIKADQMLAAQPGVPLSDTLKLSELSDDGKLLLAYTIARAVWQFYTTKFMQDRWTSDQILFMTEATQRNNISKQIALNPLHPVVAIILAKQERTEAASEQEFVSNMGLLHWAPRIFALGVVLLSIMTGEDMADRDLELSWQQKFNVEVFKCHEMLAEANWPLLHIKSDLVRKPIRDAVTACLNGGIFNKSADVAERKQLLYKHVVYPLQYVVEIAGVDPRNAKWTNRESKAIEQMASNKLTSGLLSKSSSASQDWLYRLVESQLNRDIYMFYKRRRDTGRTKIAVLDTGYDSDSLFFSYSERRERIQAWKDFVGNASNAKDEDGHGTHVLSIVMTIAPSIDVYVARIARNEDDFITSRKRIAQAIDWAVNEMAVDIISMSFGWPKEDENREISAAIETSITKRREGILYFAAASNSGGDFGTWFPASHQSVIAVRATTHEGKFDDFNAPPDYSGADVIGTLGVDVPGASLDRTQLTDVASGTSCATPVAAAIGALVLEATKTNSGSSDQLKENRDLQTLRTKRGMSEMFRAKTMSRKMSERMWYLNAWDFCNQSKEERKIVLANATLNAERS